MAGSSFVRCSMGILVAAFLLEIGLRPFVAGWNEPEGPVRTVRSYLEGFSNAHFEPDGLGSFGNRLTGNPLLAGAPEGLIVGDSHVIAQAVRDEETMGAVIERLSRDAGHPLNVRQYGWSSANAPTYLASAGALLQARTPAWVAVVLNSSNIGVFALTTTQNWRMEVAPDGSYRLIDMRHPQAVGRMQKLRREIGRSALALALWRRAGLGATENGPQDRHDPRLDDEASIVPSVTVLGLKKAYGSRLLIVYTPEFFGTDYDSLDPLEQEVLALCDQNGVACVSVRETFARERYDQFRLSRGFHNTAPGAGHFNAVGHRLIGTEIWRYLSGHSLPHT